MIRYSNCDFKPCAGQYKLKTNMDISLKENNITNGKESTQKFRQKLQNSDLFNKPNKKYEWETYG